jgi:hypothetical protein
MKYLFLSILILLSISSCETDFDVNANWQDVTIVYGLIDPNEEIQLVKINKAYLGEGDAIEMAAISDSTNYNPSDIRVTLYRIKEISFNQYDTLSSVILNDTILEKDDGLFSIDNNIIYTFSKPESFYNTNSIYSLEIINLSSGHMVTSKTEIINNFSFESLNSSFQWGLYNDQLVDSLMFRTKTIEYQSDLESTLN